MTQPTTPAAPISASSAGANTYTDLNALSGLKNNARSPQAIHAIAQQVDALFLQMMLKSMRDASASTAESDSNEMGMYQDMFDKQVALTLSQHQDLGLGSMVTRQMTAAAASASAPAHAPAYAPSPAHAPAQVPASAPAPAPASAPASTPSAAPPSASLQGSAARFVSEVLPAITRTAQALGVSPLGMLAQAALETGWGTRMPRTADGAPSLNIFGIKAGETWDGGRASAKTLEFSGGAATLQHTSFRAYGSVEESVADFANVLKNSPRYRATISAGGNVEGYINGIAQSGYATDPKYGEKLHDILHSNTLHMALKAKITEL
jgi:flagellar protein FlgJ